MAGLLDLLLGGQGGLLSLPPSPEGDQWLNAPYLGDMRSRLKIGRNAPQDLTAYLQPQTPPMAQNAPNIDLSGISPSGFGFAPPSASPQTAQAPAAAAPPLPAPVSLLENRPQPSAPPTSGLPAVNRAAPQTSPQYKAPPPSPPSAEPSGPNFGGNLMAGLQNVLHRPFSPAGIGDLITGLTTGQRTDPVGYAMQMQQRTYQALRQAGYPASDAAIGATNPAVLDLIAKNAYGEPKFAQVAPGNQGVFYGGGGGLGGGGLAGARGAPGITTIGAPITLEQKAAQETLGKQGAEQYQKIQDRSEQAIQERQVYARMRQLSPQAYAGPGAPAYQQAASLLSSTFGVPSSSVAAGDEFKMLESQLLLQKAGGRLSTGVSDTDRAALNAQVPGLANSPLGRMRMIEIGDKVAQREQQIGQLATQWIRDPSHQGSMTGFNDALAKWAQANPLFSTPTEGPGSQPATDWTTGKVGGQSYRIRQVQ